MLYLLYLPAGNVPPWQVHVGRPQGFPPPPPPPTFTQLQPPPPPPPTDSPWVSIYLFSASPLCIVIDGLSDFVFREASQLWQHHHHHPLLLHHLHNTKTLCKNIFFINVSLNMYYKVITLNLFSISYQ